MIDWRKAHNDLVEQIARVLRSRADGGYGLHEREQTQPVREVLATFEEALK